MVTVDPVVGAARRVISVPSEEILYPLCFLAVVKAGLLVPATCGCEFVKASPALAAVSCSTGTPAP